MEQQKPKFKFSYIIVLLLLVLMAVLIFGNNGYQGQLLGGGESDVYELIDGTYQNKDGKAEQLAAYYYDDNTIYFLVEGSQFKDNFPEYADYYIRYGNGDGVLERIIIEINEHNESATQKIQGTVAVEGINFWDILYPVLRGKLF